MDTFAKEGDFVLNSLLLFYTIVSSKNISNTDLYLRKKEEKGRNEV